MCLLFSQRHTGMSNTKTIIPQRHRWGKVYVKTLISRAEPNIFAKRSHPLYMASLMIRSTHTLHYTTSTCSVSS